jgi:hypothetical protein
MHLSRMTFTGHGEMTTAKDTEAGQTMCDLFGYCEAADELYDRFANPKFKVRWWLKSDDRISVVWITSVGPALIGQN